MDASQSGIYMLVSGVLIGLLANLLSPSVNKALLFFISFSKNSTIQTIRSYRYKYLKSIVIPSLSNTALISKKLSIMCTGLFMGMVAAFLMLILIYTNTLPIEVGKPFYGIAPGTEGNGYLRKDFISELERLIALCFIIGFLSLQHDIKTYSLSKARLKKRRIKD